MERFVEVDLGEELGEEFEQLHYTLRYDGEPRLERYDQRVRRAYEMGRDVGQVNENMLQRARKYVFGIEDDEIIGFSSLRHTYLCSDETPGQGIELFQMVVDPDWQGEGHGHDLLEHSLDVAEEYADACEVDALYMKVQRRKTDVFDTVRDELEERGELNGASAFRRYCEENGIDVEELCDDNIPMERLAESNGFEPVADNLFDTEYVLRVDG